MNASRSESDSVAIRMSEETSTCTEYSLRTTFSIVALPYPVR